MDIYSVNGEFITADKAVISVNDLIVLRGYGVFDFLVTYNKRPFRLTEHVERLENSARNIGLAITLTGKQICELTEETLRRNSHHRESAIKLIYSGGISSDGVTPEGNGQLLVMVMPRQELPSRWYREGAKIITTEMERFLPEAKSTNYLSAVYALEQARRQGAIESIYIDRGNRALEGTTTNIFLIRDNTLITPATGILPGITRAVVLELTRGRYPIETRDVDRAELGLADEMFITASNKEIVPVVTVDDQVVGDGRPGPQTIKIMQRFTEYTTAFGQGRL
ncbi:MAG: aminotransferase class IV [Desulfopila sp.]